jgi:hypothetical protein
VADRGEGAAEAEASEPQLEDAELPGSVIEPLTSQINGLLICSICIKCTFAQFRLVQPSGDRKLLDKSGGSH